MNQVFSMALLIGLGIGIYYVIRLIIAAVKDQPKDNFKKGLLVCVVVIVASIVGFNVTRTPEQKAAHQAKIEAENKAKEEQRIADEKAAAEKVARQEAQNAQARQASMIDEITQGWNMTSNPNNDNFVKAAVILSKYPDYVHSSPPNWIDVDDAMKKVWSYYGKVVNLSGRIYHIEQLPPDDEFVKLFGNASVIYATMSFQGSNDVISSVVYIVGSADNIAENSQINVKGYIYGYSDLVNGLGVHSRGLEFMGFAE